MPNFAMRPSLFDPTFRERVRNANPIEQIINDDLAVAGHPTLTGTGEELEGWHPAHGSTSGLSLKVNTAKQVYKCFNCGEGGDVFTWVIHTRGYTFVEALHFLAARASLPLPSLDPAQQQHWYQLQQERHDLEALFRAAVDFFQQHLTQEHVDFCKTQWGLTRETIERYKLGFAPVAPEALQQFLRWQQFADDAIRKSGLVIHAGARWHDFFQGRIVFPYWRDLPDHWAGIPGTPLYFIGRRLDGTTSDKAWEKAKYRKQLVHGVKHPYVSPTVSNTYFYGEHALYGLQARPLLVTEGVADCLVALQADMPTISPATVRFAKACYPRLLQLARHAQRLIICNDNEDNQAGTKGALATAAFLDGEGVDVRLVTLPRPAGVSKIDLADFLKSHTTEDFQHLCDEAPAYLDARLTTYTASADGFANCQTARQFVTEVLSQCPDAQQALAFLRHRVKVHFHLTGADVADLVKAYQAEQTPPPAFPASAALKLKVNKVGDPRPVSANVAAILVHDVRWRGVLAYNEFASSAMFLQRPPYLPAGKDWQPRPVDDYDDNATSVWLQNTYDLCAQTRTVSEGVEYVAHQQTYHPVRDYLDRLTWDGTPRLATWLPRYCKADDTAYTRAIGSRILIGAVARVMQPGCKLDTMPILCGPQGLLKSTVWHRLASDAWFDDTGHDLRDKDAMQSLRGKWIIEMSELETWRRSETETIKQFLSKSFDDYRPSYGRRNQRFERQCLFVGTTNKETFLVDETGNRRFWPITVTDVCDIEALTRDRDQLWAEAVVRYCQGEPWHLTAEQEALAAKEQEARLELDPWDEPISQYIAGRAWVTSADIFAGCLGLERQHLTQAHSKRIGAILRRHHWEGNKPVWVKDEAGHDKQVKAWKPRVTGVTGAPSAENVTGNTVSPTNDAIVTGVTGATGTFYKEYEQERQSQERGGDAHTEAPRDMGNIGNSGSTSNSIDFAGITENAPPVTPVTNTGTGSNPPVTPPPVGEWAPPPAARDTTNGLFQGIAPPAEACPQCDRPLRLAVGGKGVYCTGCRYMARVAS